MKLRLHVSKEKKQLFVRIENILAEEIKENSRGYYFDLSLKKIQLSIEISSVYSREMENGSVRLNQFTLKKDNDYTFSIGIGLDLNEVFHGIQRNRVQLLMDTNEGVHVKGFLRIRKEQLERYVERNESEEQNSTAYESFKDVAQTNLISVKSRKKWNNARWRNDRKQTYGALFYKFNQSMNQYAEKQKRFGRRQNYKIDPAALRRKGIYHDEFADNKCDNCYYFRGDQCSLHLVTVTIDHACFKHRGYREIQGGAFSPK